jgi:hypothetical protein
MPKRNSQVRFLGAHAARADLLGILSVPVGYDGKDVEHTRFFMVTPEKWVHRPIESDIVSTVFEDGPQGKCWWLLGKRGDVHTIRPSGLGREQIADAGTGPGKLGYLSSLQRIHGSLCASGYGRQVYQRQGESWVHIDQGIVRGEDATGYSLNDIAGNPAGVLCAVGNDGEIAMRPAGGTWTMRDSPTHAHLHALCTDDRGRFCAAGANGTVIRGDAGRFEVLCMGQGFTDALWDIEFHDGEIVVSATPGVFVVRDGALVPHDKPAPPTHTGYRLTQAGGKLWSVGSHHIFCLDNGVWTEWVCPDNVPR